MFSKAEALECMMLGLRSHPALPAINAQPLRLAAAELRRRHCAALESVCAQPWVARADKALQSCATRLQGSIQCNNVFTDLQDEVNVILYAMAACS